MPTLNDLVSQTQGMLRSYTRNTEQSTYITAAINSTDLTMTVHDGSQISRGVCEIDNEMLWVQSVNASTGAVVIAPYGRGYNGSSAASHTSNTQVIMNPVFTKKQIKDEINNTLLSLRGYLNGMSTTTFDFNAAVEGYAMPSSTNSVVRVEWKSVGPSKAYNRIRGWRFNPMADTATFNTGKSVEIYDYVTPGQTVQVWYTADIDTLTNDDDDFFLTGLPDSCQDLVTLGAAARLMATYDARTIDTFSAETSILAGKSPQGSGGNISKYLYNLFIQRRNDEVALQNMNTPISTHWSR